MFTSPDFILGIFLVATLLLALWAGQGVKTMKDYVLANRSLSTPLITMHFIATFIAGGDLGFPYFIAKYGIISLIAQPICFSIGFLIVGVIIAPHLVYFQGCLTLGDLMRKLFGNGISLFASIISLIICLLAVIGQISALVHIGSYLTQLSNTSLILGIGMIVVLYTSIASIRGVVYTDVLQFIALITLVILLTSVFVHRVGGLKSLFQSLPAEKLSFFNNKSTTIWKRLESGFFWALIPTYCFHSPILRCMLMVKDKRQARNMFFAGSIIYIFITIGFAIIGLGAIVLLKDPNIYLKVDKSTQLIGYLGKILFPGSIIIQTFLFIGSLFVLVSTIDTFLYSAGVIMVHDIIKPFFSARKVVINEVKWSKIAVFITGSFCVLISFTNINLRFRFWGDIVFVTNLLLIPLIAGILGLKTDKKSFWVFSGSFFCIAYLTSRLTTLHVHRVFLISISTATLLFFIFHYIMNRGFVIIRRTKATSDEYVWFPSWKRFIARLVTYIPTPGKLVEVAQKKVSSYGKEPFLFSLFITILWMLPTTVYNKESSVFLMVVVYAIGIALCCGLMVEVRWPVVLKRYFSLYWFLTLLYCLPFASSLSFLMSPQSNSTMLGLAIALLLLVVCVGWQAFITLSIVGIALAVVVYRILSGHFLPVISFDMGWSLITTLGAVFLVGFLFARRKELYDVNRLLRTRLYAGSIAHETKNYLSTTLFAGNRINQVIQKGQFRPLSKGDLYSIPKDLAEDLMGLGPDLALGARQSATKIDLFMQVLKEDILLAKLVVGSVKDCVEKALEDGYFDQEEVRKGLLLRLENDFNAKVHPGFFKHIICNLVKNAYDHGNATKVVLTLDAERRRLCVEDNGRGVEAESLPYVFDLFYSGGKGSGVGLALVKFVVEGFYGSVHCDSKQGDEAFTRFTIAFPELDS